MHWSPLFFEGFFLQASLILALGAQNLFVLDCGLKRQRHLFVASLCSLCDLLLIFAGVLGVTSLFIRFPLLKLTFGAVGVVFLFYYAVKKLKEFWLPSEFSAGEAESTTLKQTLLATLGFSLLNPHVYLDTVVLIGGYASKFPRLDERLVFASGVGSFSVVWFFALALLASAFSRLIHSPRAMRIISLVSGLILLWLCGKLGIEWWGWLGVFAAN